MLLASPDERELRRAAKMDRVQQSWYPGYLDGWLHLQMLIPWIVSSQPVLQEGVVFEGPSGYAQDPDYLDMASVRPRVSLLCH